MEEASVPTGGNECMDLPPGFRFHPTDEEIITHYLTEKVLNNNFSSRAIGDVDLNKCEPWDLPKKAKMGEKEWYFFCQRDRKYPTGMRTNRATEAGYWKATGKDKEIYKRKGCLVGMKKTLVFYKGRAPKGEKSNWVMHEYRLEGKFSYYNLPKATKDEWVVCRVFHKNTGIKRSPVSGLLRMNSFGDEMLDSPSLPPLYDPPFFNTNRPDSSFIEGNVDAGKNAITSSSASDETYMSYFSTGMEDQQDHKILLSNNHSQIRNQGNQCIPHPNPVPYPPTTLSNPLLSIPGSDNLGYLHQVLRNNSIPNFPISGYGSPHMVMLSAINGEASGLKRQCKVEQFSNQSMVSQDTGVSTDVNTEISSVASKHEIGSSSGCYEDFEGPSSAGPVDLDCFWNY